jgi:hypothetical protein
MNPITRCLTLCVFTGFLIVGLLWLPSLGESIARVRGVLAASAPDAITPTAPTRPDMRQYRTFQSVDRVDACRQIECEFGIRLEPGRFSSHHAARGYLDRLRLARQARALGIDVDPTAFGDAVFMARHIEKTLQERGVTEFAVDWTAGPTLQSAGEQHPPRGDYIFFHGHRYYRQDDGTYVRRDGQILGVPRSRHAPQSTDPPVLSAATPFGFDPTLPNLDELSRLLETYQLDGNAP